METINEIILGFITQLENNNQDCDIVMIESKTIELSNKMDYKPPHILIKFDYLNHLIKKAKHYAKI